MAAGGERRSARFRPELVGEDDQRDATFADERGMVGKVAPRLGIAVDG